MAKRTVSGIEVTADRIIVKLIDTLLGQQKQIDNLRAELKEQYEVLAEIQPKLLPNGQLKLLAMPPGEDPTLVEAYVTPDALKEADHGPQ